VPIVCVGQKSPFQALISEIRLITIFNHFRDKPARAVGALLLAIFPTDVPATPVSWHGAIHLVVAIIAFIGGAFGTLAISVKLGQNRLFDGLKRIALPLSLIVIIFWAIEFGLPLVFPHLNARIGGLTERLFLGFVLLWMGVVSAYLATQTRPAKAVPNQTKA
jgi:hypothetical protein